MTWHRFASISSITRYTSWNSSRDRCGVNALRSPIICKKTTRKPINITRNYEKRLFNLSAAQLRKCIAFKSKVSLKPMDQISHFERHSLSFDFFLFYIFHREKCSERKFRGDLHFYGWPISWAWTHDTPSLHAWRSEKVAKVSWSQHFATWDCRMQRCNRKFGDKLVRVLIYSHMSRNLFVNQT